MSELRAEIESEIERLLARLGISENSRKPGFAEVAEDLRGSFRVTDRCFDQVYPDALRALSDVHWTPVEVALRAAKLLVAGEPEARILDVGSGCGKFCLIGALSTTGTFAGIEQRPHLSRAGRRIARRYGLERISFLEGKMVDLDWQPYDAFYLFNPFHEQRDPSVRMDTRIACDLTLFEKYIRVVQRKLSEARPGTRVATYHGFGAEFPPGYRSRLREPAGSDHIELWVKDGENA